MKIAIHHSPGSFSDRWIEYCDNRGINFEIVNAFDSDIVKKLDGCSALMWHHHHESFKDVIAAKSILFALEHGGIKVFPDFKSAWHFDDKVAQKYLLEAVGAPLVPSYVFYDKKDAIDWAKKTTYPKVFKLKGGAGSANVRIVNNKYQCVKLIKTAFGKGFKNFDGKAYFLDTLKKYRSGKKNFQQVLKAMGRMFISTEYSKLSKKEKGYIYFQEFIPNNTFDIRIIVIDKKAFAVKRMVRKNDFRASGSGEVYYEKENFPNSTLEIAFALTRKLGVQCCAIDFVYNEENNPLIVELSYGFAGKAYDLCEGYWTENLQFHDGRFNPQAWMVNKLIREIED